MGMIRASLMIVVVGIFINDAYGILVATCDSEPCLNGATCTSTYGEESGSGETTVSGDDSFTCICPGGYTGEFCQTPMTEFPTSAPTHSPTSTPSTSSPTSAPSTSAPSPSPTSIPTPAPTRGPTTAPSTSAPTIAPTTPDPCIDEPCLHGGECFPDDNSEGSGSGFTCTCSSGYSGELCEVSPSPTVSPTLSPIQLLSWHLNLCEKTATFNFDRTVLGSNLNVQMVTLSTSPLLIPNNVTLSHRSYTLTPSSANNANIKIHFTDAIALSVELGLTKDSTIPIYAHLGSATVTDANGYDTESTIGAGKAAQSIVPLKANPSVFTPCSCASNRYPEACSVA